MLKKTDYEPYEEQWDDRERYFDHEHSKRARRKIEKEDLDTLETWDEPGDRA